MTANHEAIESGSLAALSGAARRSVDITAPSARDNERYVRPILGAAALFSGLVVTLVVAFVFWKAAPVLSREGLGFFTRGGWDTQMESAWKSDRIYFGAMPLIVGSLLTTAGAVFISLFLGLGCAVFLAELSPRWARGPISTVIQLLAGIPSVVFGLVGLSVVVPWITDNLVPGNSGDVVTEIPLDGACLLAAVIVLTFMILPFFVTVAVDSLRSIPRSYLDGGLALGMTRWRTITRIQIPSATPGLIAGIVLSAARAIGEAIAISMVAGAIAFVPNLSHGPLYFMLMPIRTMASAIVETGGEASSVPQIESALFGLAAILLAFSLSLSLLARWAFTAFNSRMSVVSERHV